MQLFFRLIRQIHWEKKVFDIYLCEIIMKDLTVIVLILCSSLSSIGKVMSRKTVYANDKLVNSLEEEVDDFPDGAVFEESSGG